MYASPMVLIVELGEYAVEQLDELDRRQAARQLGEADEIGEEDAHLGEAVGDGMLLGLEAARDRAGQDVVEEALGALVLADQRVFGAQRVDIEL
jgi:hypothetical protein